MNHHRARWVSLLLITSACEAQPDSAVEATAYLLGESPLLPFPSMQLMRDDDSSATGYRVAVPEGLLPYSEGGSPIPVERLGLLDGFSVAATAVVAFPGVSVDDANLPHWEDPAASLLPSSPVQLFDLASGERVPLFAELDAHPDAVPGQDQALLIRPLQAMAFGTPHAVVITDALLQADGTPVLAPDGFASLRDAAALPGLEDQQERFDGIFAKLEEQGLARQDLVLAWDFVTGSEAQTHAALDAVLEAVVADLPADPSHTPDYRVENVWSPDDGDVLGPYTWRVADGELELPGFLTEQGEFELDEQGLPVPQGDDSVYWMVFVPESLRGAPAGSAPVVVFGHGILASPKLYLFYEEDPMAVQALADRLGMIFIGTEWRGLCTRDLGDAAGVASDFGTFHHLTDKMIQGLANASVLPRLVRSGFASDPILQASDGSGSLVDPDRVYYFGISLGGIQGANLMAHTQDIDHAVLHVGGAVWSTMLERSSNWTAFETMMEYGVEDPLDRQVLYAVSQLMWDPVDPITHTHDLAGRSLLWQESMGDEQVPNLSTHTLARSVGLPLLGPAVEPVLGLEQVAGPLGPGAAALVQFDPQLGRPHQTNRPSDETGAHYFPRHCEPVHAQIQAFYQAGREGTIEHTCGDGPCLLDEDDHVY
jgi:hypothetical protein